MARIASTSRADFRFYVQHGVPYYRVIELFMPQAISVWYVGSGATVGFQTITGLVFLAKLLDQRDQGVLDFAVWPHDYSAGSSSRHVLLEGYPSAFPKLDDYGPCKDADQRDAWRMLHWMQATNCKGELEGCFELPSKALNSLGSDLHDRVQFEGWILGVR